MIIEIGGFVFLWLQKLRFISRINLLKNDVINLSRFLMFLENSINLKYLSLYFEKNKKD